MTNDRQRKQKQRRLIPYEYEPVRQRIVYLSELFFGGDGHEMAFALGLKYRELAYVFEGRSKPTIRLLAHIAAKLDVRTEWLVCGVGPICRTPHDIEGLQLPATLQSSFKLFDVITAANSQVPRLQLPPESKSSDTLPYVNAGWAVYRARSHQKFVGFFLGSTPFAYSSAYDVLPFYQAGFADVLAVTLSAVRYDLASSCRPADTDLNLLALFAATRGIGYGEAISTAALPSCDPDLSVLASAHRLGVPVFVAAELGEVSLHTAPSLRGAELGAAVGAAAYVDLLALTECLQNFFSFPGGVAILAGEHVRWLRLILQRMESLRSTVSEQAGFTFVVFAAYDSDLETLVHHHGGHVIFLDHPTTAAFTQLFQICNDVYAGKISHEQ
jgi:hypothetical protein